MTLTSGYLRLNPESYGEASSIVSTTFCFKEASRQGVLKKTISLLLLKSPSNAERALPSDDPIYLNHNAKLEPFKRVKDPYVSHKRSYIRLTYIVKEVFCNEDLYKVDSLFQKVQEKAQINFKEEILEKRTLTLRKVAQIENAVNAINLELKVPLSPIRSPLHIKDDDVQ